MSGEQGSLYVGVGYGLWGQRAGGYVAGLCLEASVADCSLAKVYTTILVRRFLLNELMFSVFCRSC